MSPPTTAAAADRGGAIAAKAHRQTGPGFWALTLGTIGVVYGDIGTSPLYAMRESVVAAVGPGNPANETAVFGILSLIIWALILVVTVKYVVILLRADNNREGGTLALMALAQRSLGKGAGAVMLCGITGAALFYGDAMITPALSLLSAIEGLKVVTPALDRYVVPLTMLILVLLFAVQSRGTARVAAFFGPVTLVWFVAIAVAGLWQVVENPTVLWAFNPAYGVQFLASHGMVGLVTLGAVFLVVTGSSALASAYGIAVTGTMVVTVTMAFVVVWRVWRWPALGAAALILPFLFIDLTFLGANLLKVVEGGWVPLAFGGLIMVMMYTWRRGSRLLLEKTRRQEISLDELVRMLEKKPPTRVPGTAVFLTSTPNAAPTALMHSLKHYKVLHEHNVILTIETVTTPRVDATERVRIKKVGETFTCVVLRFGFMETPNVPKALAIARKLGWTFDIMSTSFFLSRRSLKPAAHSGMPRWQDRLFIMLTRIANDATDYFQIPTGRVVEVGTQVTI